MRKRVKSGWTLREDPRGQASTQKRDAWWRPLFPRLTSYHEHKERANVDGARRHAKRPIGKEDPGGPKSHDPEKNW